MAVGVMSTMFPNANCVPVSRLSEFVTNDPSTSFSPGRAIRNVQVNGLCTIATRFETRGLGFTGRSLKLQVEEVECSFRGLGSSHKGTGFCSQSTLLRDASTIAGSAFAEPSVTEGEVQKYEKQLTGQEEVLEYFEEIGIDTADLDGLELPSSLEVVRERIQFLQKIGLTVEDINDYPLMLGCSVKKNLIPVLNYLESLGVTTKSLPILIRRYPRVLHSSVVVDLQPIVEYLEGLGIERADMGSVLARYPDVFGFKIEGTMSTSTAFLVMLGVNPRKIGAILTQMPQIMGMRVGNNIKRKVDFLQSFGISHSAISKMIEERPMILGLNLSNQMRPAVDSLVETGVGKDAIGGILMQYPDILGLDVNSKLEEKLPWLSSVVGVSKDDIGEILIKLPQILLINVTKGSEKVDYLRQAGFSAEDICSMVVKSPKLLAASIERTLKPNLEYLVETMNRTLEEVVEFPAYLLYNLELRIRPRYEQMAVKRMQCSLAWMFNCTDEVFQQRLTGDYVGQENEGEEEMDVPYIVTRRTRLLDDGAENIDASTGEDDDS